VQGLQLLLDLAVSALDVGSHALSKYLDAFAQNGRLRGRQWPFVEFHSL
jgi:hypothetical protein